MDSIPECFYRVSVKALVLNETKDKFLICEEVDGVHALPGGGLDWGVSPEEDLKREIKEEMGIEVTAVAENPTYFFTDYNQKGGFWLVNVLYEAKLKNLDFVPSDECISVKFVDQKDIESLKVYSTISKLASVFDPSRHR